jgi:hypothetical protein
MFFLFVFGIPGKIKYWGLISFFDLVVTHHRHIATAVMVKSGEPVLELVYLEELFGWFCIHDLKFTF